MQKNLKIIKFDTENDYNLINKFLFDYALKNNYWLTLNQDYRGLLLQDGDSLEVFGSPENKRIELRGLNSRKIQNLEKKLKEFKKN